MGNSIWGPYGAHMDVPRWVPDESLFQNPHRSHMGCPYRTHIITHLGPIWVPYSLLAGLLWSSGLYSPTRLPALPRPLAGGQGHLINSLRYVFTVYTE